MERASQPGTERLAPGGDSESGVSAVAWSKGTLPAIPQVLRRQQGLGAGTAAGSVLGDFTALRWMRVFSVGRLGWSRGGAGGGEV